MFSKLAFFVAAFAAITMASPVTPPLFNACNSGPVVCCNTLAAPHTAAAQEIIADVGVAVEDVVAQVGAQCNAITGIGAGTGVNWYVYLSPYFNYIDLTELSAPPPLFAARRISSV